MQITISFNPTFQIWVYKYSQAIWHPSKEMGADNTKPLLNGQLKD